MAADPCATAARRWLALAVAVLLLAGCFALLLVLGRTPPFDRLAGDPDWFRRCLVVHVVLALVLWFQSFLATLLLALPPHPARGRLAGAAQPLAWLGLAMLAGSAWLPGTRPVLSNYVPVIDHWLFGAGLGSFGIAVLGLALSRRLLPSADEKPGLGLPAAATPFLRASIVALLLGALTVLAAGARLTPGLTTEVRCELLFWGVGHVLQLASVLGMTAVWCWAASAATGRPPLSRGLASGLAAATLLPWLAAPLLVLPGTWTSLYREGFTRLMQFALLPAPLCVAVLCGRALWRAGRPATGQGRTLAAGFWVSVALTLLGLALGAAIRGADTMVPAHYHASIGAVTVAFMAGALALLPVLGLRDATARAPRATRLQPWLYGAGQALFALGFAFAGAPRKAYGAEQAGYDLAQTIGLAVMGVGGFVAVAAGLTFLAIFVRCALGRSPAPAAAQLHATRA